MFLICYNNNCFKKNIVMATFLLFCDVGVLVQLGYLFGGIGLIGFVD